MPSRPDRSGLLVRPATRSDIEFTARTHSHQLPHGLFPLLGQPFMRRWHQTFLLAPQGVALVAVRTDREGERLAGFLVGAVDQVGLVQHVVQHHRLQLGAVGVWSLLLRPRLGLHFLRTRAPAYVRRLAGRPAAPDARGDSSDARLDGRPPGDRCAPVAVITAVVVTPDARGVGAGAELVAEFVARARIVGAPEAQLTTLDGPEGAGPFYEALGWKRQGVHPTRDGVLMATYCLPLDQPAAEQPSARATDRAPEEGPRLHDQPRP